MSSQIKRYRSNDLGVIVFANKVCLDKDVQKIEDKIKELELFRDNLLEIMSDCYRDGMSRASFGLDFDFEYSRTKLLIERGNYYYT